MLSNPSCSDFGKEKDGKETDTLGYSTKPEVFIALMGKTGTGKTSFINHATGEDSLEVGNDLESCILFISLP
jgi:putative ribosome biogenesis GTPase RsgA